MDKIADIGVFENAVGQTFGPLEVVVFSNQPTETEQVAQTTNPVTDEHSKQ